MLVEKPLVKIKKTNIDTQPVSHRRVGLRDAQRPLTGWDAPQLNYYLSRSPWRNYLPERVFMEQVDTMDENLLTRPKNFVP